MTEDAWFGVTPEPIAKYISCVLHTKIKSNNLKQDRSTHRRVSAKREDSHRGCVRGCRRQRHRARALWPMGTRLCHREGPQDDEVRKAQCRNLRRLEQDLLADRRLFRCRESVRGQQERDYIRQPAMGR
jgi:hypothetical protein